jgi:spermidine synthase
VKKVLLLVPMLILGATIVARAVDATLVYEVTSAYHHIRVVDEGRVRILNFNSAPQSRMSLDDPLKGQFEYIEYLHLPWLWNPRIRTVLLIGLGGGSFTRTAQARHPGVTIETVELDPAVIETAKTYFGLQESDTMRVVAADGRQFLRRSTKKYDLIVLDAYTTNRYGSGIPYSLVTREFFRLVREHLSPEGLFACNVIGSLETNRNRILATVYKTLQTSFPGISLFPARGSGNVVMVASLTGEIMSVAELERRADRQQEHGPAADPMLHDRIGKLLTAPPDGTAEALVLTDDFAPVDGLLKTQPGGATLDKEQVEALRRDLTKPSGSKP